MPIKKDETGNRRVEMEIIVPGSAEGVWEAVATGNGNTGWFVKTEIEPRVGGALTFDFGEGVATSGEVTIWEPPHRFGYVEREWDVDAPPVETQITIAPRSGHRCVLRMVHSLVSSSDDWDDQLEGFEGGWPGYFAILRVYLEYFAGGRAASFMAMAPADHDALPTWVGLVDALGLAGANVGERRELLAGPERCSGVVEHVHQDRRQRYALLRVDDPSPGMLMIGTYETGITSHGSAGPRTNVSVNRYFFGDDVSGLADESAARWRGWLSGILGREGKGAQTP